MNKTLENKYANIITKRNTKKYIDHKVKLKFYLLFFVGLAIGSAFFFVGRQNDMKFDATQLNLHFNSVFIDCASASDYFIDVIKISESDLSHVFFIFISGFTYFCFAISGIIVFFKGFMLGFSALYLINALYLFLAFPASNFLAVIFVFIKLLQSILIVCFSSEAYIFSYDFRSIKHKQALLIRSPIAYKFIFFLLQTVGASLLLNFIYCVIIFLLYH